MEQNKFNEFRFKLNNNTRIDECWCSAYFNSNFLQAPHLGFLADYDQILVDIMAT